MKKIILSSIFAVALLATAGWGVNKNMQSYTELSYLALRNVLALANVENSDSGNSENNPGNYDIIEAYSNHYYNGVLYRQTKSTDCLNDGSYACSSGNWFRYYDDNEDWGDWIPQ